MTIRHATHADVPVYTSRILPQEEWPRLVGTEAEGLWPHLNPEESRVIVVERGDEIVGTWVAMRVVHVECVWIAPAYRGSRGIVRRLLSGMIRVAQAWGAKVVWTAAMTDDVRGLLTKLGATRVPGDAYVMSIPGGEK